MTSKSFPIILEYIRKFHQEIECHSVEFISSSSSEVYRLRTKTKNFILKIYKPEFISEEDLYMQLIFFEFLAKKRFPCCTAVPDSYSNLYTTMLISNSKEFYVLYEEAWGRSVNGYSPQQIYNLGMTIAHLHETSLDFPCIHTYRPFTIDWLVEQPAKNIMKEAKRLSIDPSSFLEIVGLLKEDLVLMESENANRSIFHGDIHFSNMHFTQNDQPILFDFDHSHYGYSTYDLAFICLLAKTRVNFNSKLHLEFIKGYEKRRKLSTDDICVAKILMLGFHIMAMGHHCRYQNGKYPQITHKYLNDNFAVINQYKDLDSFYSVIDGSTLPKREILGGTTNIVT